MALAVKLQHEVRRPLGRGNALSLGILFDSEQPWERRSLKLRKCPLGNKLWIIKKTEYYLVRRRSCLRIMA